MRRILFLLLLVTSVAKAQTRIFIPEPYGDSFIESELIADVSYFELKVERFNTINPSWEMKVDGENYFILNDTLGAYHFDGEGNVVNLILDEKKEHVGTEPLLNNPSRFAINPTKKEIEIYSFNESHASRYSYDGTLNDRITFPITPSDFIRTKEGNYYLYTGWNNNETQYRLIKTDGDGKTLERKMRLITNCMPTEGFSFYTNDDKIYLWELLGNFIYELDGEKTKPLYRLDYGSKNLPLNYHMLRGEDSFHMIHETGYYTVKKFLVNKDFAYFFLNYSSGEQLEMFHVIHDRNSNEVYTYTENSAIKAFNKAQYLTDDNELVFLVSSRKFRRALLSGNEFVPAPFEGIPDSIRRIRNPLIIKLKLDALTEYNEDTGSSDGSDFQY